jgi:hypothetical protein
MQKLCYGHTGDEWLKDVTRIIEEARATPSAGAHP